MAKYLLLKHYRGGPAPLFDTPMDQWKPEEVSAHMQFMEDFATRLQRNGEFVDSQALSMEGTFVRYDGEGRPPVTDGPFAESAEVVNGLYYLAAADRDGAVTLAAQIPVGDKGGIELRRVVDMGG